MKKYNNAPLPFQGQKRNFVKKFTESLDHFPENSIYVDLFGGSGLLGNAIKQRYPKSEVVYNDFDGYVERLKNISKTNELILEIREILKDLDKKARVPEDLRKIILKTIKEKDYVDYITMSSNLLFSGNYVGCFDELKLATLYNRVTTKPYDASDYLTGVKVLSLDYRELFERYKDVPNVVFIFDPPYLSTDVKSYNKCEYWKLTDYLNILKLLKNKSFYYFTSNKGQLLELCEWLEFEYGDSPFKEATTTTTTTTTVNYSSSFTDIMIYKNVG